MCRVAVCCAIRCLLGVLATLELGAGFLGARFRPTLSTVVNVPALPKWRFGEGPKHAKPRLMLAYPARRATRSARECDGCGRYRRQRWRAYEKWVKQSLELTREYPAPGFDSHWAMTISRRRATTSRQWTRPGRIGFGATSCFPNSCRRGAMAMAMVAMARTISNCKLNCRSALASRQRALMVVALN